jgi:hypothetical protein
MKVGEVVRFRDQDYRVGECRTDTSIELVDLENRSRGLWVSRDEVLEASQGSEQSDSWEYIF